MYNNVCFFFSMYTILFFFLCHLVAPKGGCPSPRACGAYPLTSPGFIATTFSCYIVVCDGDDTTLVPMQVVVIKDASRTGVIVCDL